MKKSTRYVTCLSLLLSSTAMMTALSTPALAFNPATSGYTEVLSTTLKTPSTQWENKWWYQTLDACETAVLPKTLVYGPNGITLHIQSLETIPACAGTTHQYSYSHLDAFGTAYTNAYWEASIQTSPNAGTLTAWWLLPESGAWPPEVDITEVRGDYPNTSYMTNHYNTNNTTQQFYYNATTPLNTAFHTYGVLLDGKNVTWYFDGVQKGQSTIQAGETGPMFPVLSLYTGTCYDGWAGCPQGGGTTPLTGWSSNVNVKWVHVWTKTP